MKPNFSFLYNGEKYDYSAFQNNQCVIDDTLTVTLQAKEYEAYNAAEWVLYFENKSNRNSGLISDIWDCDVTYDLGEIPEKRNGYMAKPGNIFVKTMNGMVPGEYYWENDKVSSEEYQFNDIYLHNGRTRKFQNICARSSEGMMPFFTLEYKDKGFISAVGWTGSWKTEFARQDSAVSYKSGLQKTKFYLKGGEKVRTSSVLLMEFSETEDKFNKFRRLIKNHFSHKACTKATREGLMACEMWGGLPSEEIKKRLREFETYGIRFEDLWMDAGWYGQCTKCDDAFSGDWGQHTGEWEINQRVHPNLLTDVIETANTVGMNLMLWFEPERVTSHVPVFKEHPDWFINLPNNGSHILNYANEEALQWVFRTVSDYIEKLGMSCYRQDFNTNLQLYFDQNEEENRIGIMEIQHIMGMYRLWDMLLEKYPHLLIDNCASGGRRIDIETIKRSIPFFRSDYQCNFNENSDVLQVHNVGISHYLPYNGCTTKTKSDMYAVRSAFSSSWGGAYYNAIFQSMEEEDFVWAKKASDEYLRIRHYYTMDFYNHGSAILDDTAWAIWQYHDYEKDEGMVMAFRRSNSPFESVEIALKGLSENKEYTYESLDAAAFESNNQNLKITLPEKRSSTIILYKSK